ncbi:Laminin g domain-containing protein [Pandoravirus kuranda]|uniref:Laminin g domain-containing protein n=1 Tax=Pandoravirus kuranda TaxID=3019033 RepID=A0AA95J2B2_9VIRU|nr:Laminin g domain-containing protein [Pandoravirus kuranda]
MGKKKRSHHKGSDERGDTGADSDAPVVENKTVMIVEARRARKDPRAVACPLPPVTPPNAADQVFVFDTFPSGTLPIVPPPAVPCVRPLPSATLPTSDGQVAQTPFGALAVALPNAFAGACGPCGASPVPPPPPPPPLNFYYFTVPGVITANDGVVTPAGPTGGVRIASQPFTQSIPPVGVDGPVPFGTLDHPKFLALSECAFPIAGPPDVETYFEIEAAAFTQNTQNNPFGLPFVADPYDDLRLAASALVTIDLNTFMVADMFLTNGGVYALYERLESGRTSGNNYASFTDAVKVATRDRANPANDVVNVGIGWTSQAIRWYVNRREVRRVDRIGFRAPNYPQVVLIDRGGEDQLVVPQSVSVGLGNFSLLDAFRPNNYAGVYVPGLTFNNPLVLLSSIPDLYRNPFAVDPLTGEYVPLAPGDFVDPLDLSTSRIFGQGATFIVRYLLAALRSVPKSI